MNPEQLKNYGKSWPDIVSSPGFAPELAKVTQSLKRELRRELGWFKLLRLIWATRRELRRMRDHDWSKMEAEGTSRRTIEALKFPAAAVRALASVVGREQAARIYQRALDDKIFVALSAAFPTLEDFAACDENPFTAARAYMRALVIADSKSGFHRAEIVEDNEKAFAYNITYCAQCQIAEEFGDRELCYPRNCYGDEVFLGKITQGTGAVFRRTGTLATGAKFCDFRFEVADTKPEEKLYPLRVPSGAERR